MRLTTFLLFLLSFGISSLEAQPRHRVVINEFLASNVETNAEIADFNDFSDWLELYNTEDVAVDIGGCFITDKPGNRCKWRFPQGTVIDAKGTLLVWADGYDEIPGAIHQRPYYPFASFVTKYYHANFKLDKAGEFLAFVGPDSVIIDSVSYGRQWKDVSCGRSPDGAANWVFFGEPTPGSSNTVAGSASVEYASPPSLSLQGGFYTGLQIVTMSAPSAGAEIRYTLDGSRPTGSSPLYAAAITIDSTTVLTARTFEPGKAPSTRATQTYFIGIGSTLPVIAIATPPPLLWDPAIGIYAHNFKSREIPIHFEYYTEQRSPGFALDASLTLTGQASLLYPQKSFTIGTDDRFGTDAITYQVFPERKLDMFSSLYLRNAGVPDHRSTFFRDALIHSLALNRIDLDCQAYRPAAVFLNARYWGILNVREKTDRFYIGALHNVNPDDVDMLEYETEVTPTVMEGQRDNYDAFYQYVSSTDLSLTANYRQVESWMDIEEFINYQITEIYCDNVFWANENVRMWRERRPGGRWRWILQDTDYGFGMPNPRSTGYTHNTLRFATSTNFSDPFVPPPWSTLLFRKLLLNEEFKTKFIQRFAGYLNTVFHPDTVVALIDRFESRLSAEMPRHIERWKDGEPYYGDPIPDYAAWLANVNVLRTFARQRPLYQRQHIVDYFQLAGTTVLQVSIAAQGTGRVRINGVENIERNSPSIHCKGIPAVLEAIPGVGFRFVRWEGTAQLSGNPATLVPAADTLSVTAVFEAVAVNEIPAHITRDTTLTLAHSPYVARADVVVDSGATLRITEGVRLFMPDNASLLVYGRLLVEGTASSPVTISPNDQSRSWGALCFISATDSSIVTHLQVVRATRGPNFTRDRAAISGYASRICLQDVTVEDVQMPLFVRYGSVVVRHCRLHTTYAGDLINIKSADVAITEECDLRGGEGFDSDGIDYDGVRTGVIRNNRIHGIYGFNSDAVDLGEGASDILVENNTIFNINDKGVSVGQGSTTQVRRNVIANCGMGVAVKDFHSHAQVEQNTFYANQVAVACYEKNLGHGGGEADVVNTVLANSSASAVQVDNLSRLTVSYSISNTDTLAGLHNLKTEPLFLNNLALAAGSPAIDFGSPLLPPDPDGSLPDAGAFPFDPLRQNSLVIDEIHYHPVEGTEFEFIELYNAGPAHVHMNGFRIGGDVHYQFGDATIASGEYVVIAKNRSLHEGKGYQVFQWNDGSLPDGMGSVLLSDNGGLPVDAVDYANRPFWPVEPDGQGPSLELRQTTLENLAASSWSISYASGGSPGVSRSSALLTGLFINEFMADNDAVYADEEGEYDDWIEIYNGNSVPVDIGGLYVTDKLTSPDKCLIPTHDAPSTTIPAKGFLVLWADGQVGQGTRHVNIKLDRAGEQIGLARVVDSRFVFIDSLTFQAQQRNRSFGRTQDGGGTWVTFASPTPGAGNQPTGVGPVTPMPVVFALEQNFPNPFNPTTVVRYQVPAVSDVRIVVYDMLGREVGVLVNERKPPGTFEVKWDGTRFATGVYVCRMTAGENVASRRMLLIK